MRLPEDPSILVLLVATDGAAWLPDVLRGLRAQTHRPVSILAVDNASSDGSTAMLEKAFGVRRVVALERRVGYGRALAAALTLATERAIQADAILLLHDDCALAPGSLEAMVTALQGDNVGIVGAKLVEWDAPDVLQDIGQTTDRYGRAVPRVERGELDQGQHDGVHDVLFAQSAAMLIGREVIEKVGLFDPRFVALRDDLDLCWRARIAGYRTVVTTDASARHVCAAARDLRESPVKGRTRYFGDRNMIASLIKNYSALHLAVALPVTLVVSALNAVLYLARGRRASALQVLEALQWNIAHLPSTFRLRVKAQHARTESDAVVTSLMHHGATRLRAQIEGAMEKVVGEVDEGTDDELDAPRPRVFERLRAHPSASIAVIAVLVALVGARTLFGSEMLVGTDLAPFPQSAADFMRSFGSGWRGAGFGGAAPATPGLVLLGLLSFLCFGSTWLAQRVLVLGLPVVGALAMLRLARGLDLEPAARRVAVIAYAASPLMMGALGAGRLPDLVLVAFAPLLIMPLLRAIWTLPDTGWRATTSGVAWLAVAGSLSPWAFLLVAGVGLILTAVMALGPKPVALPVLRRTALMVGGALALLFPWSLELFKAGSPMFAGGAEPPARMLDLLGLTPGAVRVVPFALSFGLVIAAVAGAIAAPARRRRSADLATALAIAGLAASWAVARGVPFIAPRAALPLTVTVFALTLLLSFAAESVGPALTSRTFGRTHILAGIVGASFALQLGTTVAWVARGDHPALVSSKGSVPSVLAGGDVTAGAYRVAWIAGTAAAPRAWLTGPRGATMTTYLARSTGAGADALRRAVAQIAGGSTEAGGRLLATFGVRAVVVQPSADRTLAHAVARQIDLRFAQTLAGGALLYEDQVGLSVAASAQDPGWLTASRRGVDAAIAAGPSAGAGSGLKQESLANYVGSTLNQGGSTVLLAEDFSDGWRLTEGSTVVQPRRSFGWATAFDVSSGGDIRIDWKGQRIHRAALVLEMLIIAVFIVGRSQRAARERGER